MKHSTLINFLKVTKLFQYLDHDELQLIMKHGQLVKFSNNEILLAQGQLAQGLFVLIDGKAIVTATLLGKGELELATILPGQFVGEVNVIENLPCTATVAVQGITQCFLISKMMLDMLRMAFPQIHYKLTQSIVEKVTQRQRTIHDTIALHYENISVTHRQIYLMQHYKKNAAKKIIKTTHRKKIRMLAYLFDLPIFQSLNHKEMHHVFRIAQIIEVDNQYQFIEENKVNQSCYYVLRGAIQLSVPVNNGFVKFAVFGPNHLVCSINIFNQQPELFNYNSCGPATLLELSYDALMILARENKTLWYKLHNLLCSYTVSLQRKLNTQMIRMACEENMSHMI